MSSPTQRTLAECRSRGWRAAVVERWIPQTQRRLDAFGFGDVLAIGQKPWLIQATSGSNVSKRVAKITGECAWDAAAWLDAGGGILVWGWKRYAKPVDRKWWRVIEREITLADLGDRD